MPNQTGPHASVTKVARLALSMTLVLMGLTFLGCLAMGLRAAFSKDPELAAAIHASLGMLVSLLVGFWAVVAYGIVRVIVTNEHHVGSTGGRIERLETLATDQAESMRRLRELACLSDKAKSLIYRDSEIEAFRETVQHALFRQDYQAAEQLIEEIEQRIGYAEEAQRLRKNVADFRNATMEEKVQAAVDRVAKLIGAHDWARALRETQRLGTVFADNAKIAELPRRIHLARTKHKRDLLQAYGEATRKKDVDRSIDLLTELDPYLTPQEAAALRESARGVFKARLSNLGVQFAIFVEDEQWAQAIAAGEEIIREFPNTRMAQEARSKMDSLRTRADAAPNPAT